MAKPKITYTATNPATDETREIETTREGINHVVFGFNTWSGEWWTTLSVATDPIKALRAAKSSVGAGYKGELHVVPATRL